MKNIVDTLVVRVGLAWIKYARSLDAFSYRLKKIRQWGAFSRSNSSTVPRKLKAAYDSVVGGAKLDLVVSLTSYPGRIGIVHKVIWSVLKQSYKPNRIILWLSPEEFPQCERELPSSLTSLCKRGLEIRWCECFKSYQKLIPTVRECATSAIVTLDDDVTYGDEAIAELVQEHLRSPSVVVCHAVQHMTRRPNGDFVPVLDLGRDAIGESFCNQPVGMGSALYPPGCFDAGITDGALAMRIAPTNDDLWFWVHVICNGWKVKLIPYNKRSRFFHIEGSQEVALWQKNDTGLRLYWRDLDRLREHYPEFKRLTDQCPVCE